MPQTEHSTVYSTQGELELGINFAPAIVREHGLRDAHLQPLVAWRKGQSFRVHARKAWGYPSLELRAGNSWPAVTLDCDLPTVVDALHSLKSTFPLPVPNMVVERQSTWALSCKLVSFASCSPGRISTRRTVEEAGADH